MTDRTAQHTAPTQPALPEAARRAPVRRSAAFATAASAFATIAAASLLVPGIAMAQVGSEGARPAALEKIASCRGIVDDAARLACFDRESEALIAAADEGEVKLVDREEAKTIRKSLYGYAVPEIPLLKETGGETAQDLDKLQSTITAVRSLPRGYWQVTIAEGNAVWESTTQRRGLNPPKVGQKVEFEKAALGTYWMRINGQMGVKARRVN